MKKSAIIGILSLCGAKASFGFLGVGDTVIEVGGNTWSTLIQEIDQLTQLVEDFRRWDEDMANFIGDVNEVMAFANKLKNVEPWNLVAEGSKAAAAVKEFENQAEQLGDWSDFNPGIEFSVTEKIDTTRVPSWDEMKTKDLDIMHSWNNMIGTTRDMFREQEEKRRSITNELADEGNTERNFMARSINSLEGLNNKIQGFMEWSQALAQYEVQTRARQIEEDTVKEIIENDTNNAAVDALGEIVPPKNLSLGRKKMEEFFRDRAQGLSSRI